MKKNNFFKLMFSTIFYLGMVVSTIIFFTIQSNASDSVSATYTNGDIPTELNSDCSTLESLQLSIPAGNLVTSVDVKYDMTAQNNGWKSDQRSQIRYVEGNTDEGGYVKGNGDSEGTQSYNRTGLTLANGASGTVTFEMKTYRVWGSSGCNTRYNKVDNNTWRIKIHYDHDTDGDGILDNIDIDDDNDGILDINESILDSTDFELHGDATQISDNEVRLTKASNNQFGTSMSIRTVDLSHNFTIDAEIYLGTKDGGADGMSFVLHNDPDGSSAIGTAEGSTLGSMANDSIKGIRNGLSIEFDTYKSVSGSDDPSEDHTQIRDTDYSFKDTGGRVTNVTKLSNLEDGNWHSVHLEWDASASELSYTIDGTLMPGLTDSNIANDYFDGSNIVYYGFTAATGGLNNEQKIRYVSSTSLKDTDNDGIYNSYDLDSDNDGIPDNIEGQTTGSFTVPSGNDTDGDGLDDAYDPDDGGTSVALPDSDNDSKPDFVDTDSDDDKYSDCEEGINPSQGETCPLTGVVGKNGMLDRLESADDYASPNNGITNPNPDNGSTDILNEQIGNNEAAYRELVCGKSNYQITAMQWRLISIPCDTGNNAIKDIFSGLGEYGDDNHWVMYAQTGNDNYEVNSTKKNTDKERLDENASLELGKSYWIIADADYNLSVTRGLSGISPTGTEESSSLGISDSNFTKVKESELPNNQMSIPNSVKKYMAGNPLPFAFMVEDLYFSHGGSSGSYKAMGDSDNDTYIDPTFYKHDSADKSDLNTSNGGGYEAVNAGTPGFDHGGIKAMEGFFIKIEKEESDSDANHFAYPFMIH